MKNKMMEQDVENMGIMAGFKDMMEMEDDDTEDTNEEDRVASEVMGRSPKSPEILMNNLRGDMRSIDARVDELADMVGYRAAKDTPQGSACPLATGACPTARHWRCSCIGRDDARATTAHGTSPWNAS
jgi:hypothetical protein